MLDYFNFFTQNTDYGSSRTRSFVDIFPDFKTFQTVWNDTTFSKQAVALTQSIPEGGQTDGGQTDGGQTDGGQTDGGQTDGGQTDGPANLLLIYELLLSRYANSTIASSDENRFALQCMATIFQYAPAWIKRLEIQHTLHEMDLTSDEFLRGSSMITNVSLNPSEDPGTDTLDALSTINQQNVNTQKRDKFKALAILEELLKTDITGSFIDKFRPLFRTIVAPQRPLFYITEEPNE